MRNPLLFLFPAFALAFGLISCREANSEAIPESLESEAGVSPPLPPNFQKVLQAVENVLDTKALPVKGPIIPENEILALSETCRNHLKNETFAQADALLDDLLKSGKHGESGNLAYSKVLLKMLPAPESTRWMKKTGSNHSFIIQGKLETARAWASRGNGWSSTVTKAGHQGFENHLKTAAGHYLKGKAIDPDNPELLNLSMRIALGLGMDKSELPGLIKTSVESPHSSGPVAARILWFLAPRWHGSVEEYLHFIGKEMPKWPDSAPKFIALIQAISTASDWGDSGVIMRHPETIRVLQRIIDRSHTAWPKSAATIYAVAHQQNEKNNFKESLKLCTTYAETYPDSAALLRAHGKALYRLNHTRQASSKLLKSIQLDPSSAWSHFEMAHFHGRARRFAAGENYAKKAIELLPVNELWERSRCYTYLAGAADERNDHKRALPLAKKSIEISPSSLGWYLYGESLYVTGDKALARKAFLQAIKMAPSYESFIDRYFPGWRQAK